MPQKRRYHGGAPISVVGAPRQHRSDHGLARLDRARLRADVRTQWPQLRAAPAGWRHRAGAGQVQSSPAKGKGSASALHGLFDAIDQLPGRHFEAMCNSHQQGERRLAFATLQLAVVRPIYVGHQGKCVLRDFLSLTLLAYDLAEGQCNGRVERGRPRLGCDAFGRD